MVPILNIHFFGEKAHVRTVLCAVLHKYGIDQIMTHEKWWTTSCWLFLRR